MTARGAWLATATSVSVEPSGVGRTTQLLKVVGLFETNAKP